MNTRKTLLILFSLVFCFTSLFSFPGQAFAKDKFRVAVSIYAGWMPYYYLMETDTILDEAGKKYGVEIEIVAFQDYIQSINAFVSGDVDACVMTNMEALDMPAQGGIPCLALITGDYSNGNDAVMVRNGLKLKDLKGKTVPLVELSVSQYLLARGLEMKTDFTEYDINIENTSDLTIGSSFISNKKWEAIVTWNPIVMQVAQIPGVTNIFDSSEIPGEILDLLVANRDVVEANPKFAKAMVEAWYKTMDMMTRRGAERNDAMDLMASLAGCSETVEYLNQLKTTYMFYTPEKAIEYVEAKEIKENMERVRNFCFEHGLLGESAANVDVVGIKYPDGTIQGDPNNVRLWFDTSYARAYLNQK